MLIQLPFDFLSPVDMMLTIGAISAVAAPAVVWAVHRARAARQELQRLRAELADARGELTAAYGRLTATREALDVARADARAVIGAQPVHESLRAEVEALRGEVRRLALDATRPIRPTARPDNVTPH
jgi:cell division protein FtsL